MDGETGCLRGMSALSTGLVGVSLRPDGLHRMEVVEDGRCSINDVVAQMYAYETAWLRSLGSCVCACARVRLLCMLQRIDVATV